MPAQVARMTVRIGQSSALGNSRLSLLRLMRAPFVLLECTSSALPFSPGGTSMARVARFDLPQCSVLEPLYAKAGFADAFAIDLPSNATGDAARLAAHMLMGQARWVGWLIALRDTLVAGFGLKTSSELRDDVATDRIDFFRVYDRRRHEIILGEDDRHLDFRLSVLVADSALCRRLVATTVVTFNDLGARLYRGSCACPSPDRQVVFASRRAIGLAT